MTRLRYANTLPDIPFDPKFIHCPFTDLNRFVAYKTTALERNYKYDLLTEPDLGVQIDLINPDTYAIDAQQLSELKMDPLDEKLLEEEPLGGAGNDSRRSAQHNKVVPWLRKTEYISSEYNRFGNQTERTETKVGHNIKKLFKEDNIYRDRRAQLDAISRTFDEVAKPIRQHYAKRGVVPVAELPVFPDFQLWRYPFAQVIFDADPAPAGLDPAVQNEKMCSALIRGMMDESGEQFVAYFLPTDETLDKRRREGEREEKAKEAGETEQSGEETTEDEKQQDYKLAREYNWTVKNKNSKGYEENYLFVVRDEAVTYNELETRVRLSRRRAKEGQPRIANSRLIVRRREFNEDEQAAQEERLLQLAPPAEEEEEEEEEDKGPAAEAQTSKQSQSAASPSSSPAKEAAAATPTEADEDGSPPAKRSKSSSSDSDSD